MTVYTTVCAHIYLQIDEELLQKLYGVSNSRKTKEFWNKLVISKLVSKLGNNVVTGWEATSNVNLSQLYQKTTPKLWFTLITFLSPITVRSTR